MKTLRQNELKKKILLVTPPYHCGVLESAGTWMPLGLAYIAGSVRQAGFEVKISDAMAFFHSAGEIRQTILDFQPDVVGTSAYTSSIIEAINVLALAKEVNPDCITLLGGIHPTFCWREILQQSPEVDFIVRGEGERTTTELIEQIFSGKDPGKISGIAYRKNGVPIVTKDRPQIKDLDSLPVAWDLIDWPRYSFKTKKNSVLAIVSSSRGCTQKCTFCSQRLFWREKWRGRKPEKFVEEILMLKREFGVTVVMIADETPTYDRERWEKILDLLIAAKSGVEVLLETRVDDILRDKDIMPKYREAGIIHIYVGVESARQKTLDRFQKDISLEASKAAIDLINQQDIISETSFVLGMPDETPETIQETILLAKHYNPDLAFFLAIAPWPYSDIYEELKPHIEEFDYSKYNLVEPIIRPISMTREELNKALLGAFRSFYTGKLETLDQMSPFKRKYMIDVTKLLITDSYLSKQMKGVIPPEVQRLLGKIT